MIDAINGTNDQISLLQKPGQILQLVVRISVEGNQTSFHMFSKTAVNRIKSPTHNTVCPANVGVFWQLEFSVAESWRDDLVLIKGAQLIAFDSSVQEKEGNACA